MQMFRVAFLVASVVALAGCADWGPYFVHQKDVCFAGWYGYWDDPCPPPPVKAMAAAPGGFADELFAAQQQNAALRRRISELERQEVAAAPSGSSDELFAAQQQNAALRRRISELEQQLAAAKAAQRAVSSPTTLETAKQRLVRALRPQIEKGDITVDLNNERLLIKLASSYLFGSGEDQLKTGGADALRQVGGVLKDFPENQVHVAGYTDNVAIRGALKKKFLSNMELSEARANSAAQALREGGVSSNLSAAGHGDSNPVANNDTPGGRAKNRRVEIIVK